MTTRSFSARFLDRRTIAGLIAATTCLLSLAALVFWRLKSRADSAVSSQRASMAQEDFVAFEKLRIPLPIAAAGELVPSQGVILDVLPFGDELLISATDGLYLYDAQGHKLRRSTIQDGWPAGDIVRMILHRGTPVLAVTGHGILFYDREPQLVSPIDSAYQDPTDLLSTPQGDLWIATRSGGLLLWRDQHLRRSFPDRIKKAHITALAGTTLDLWVGTYDGGLAHYFQGAWRWLHRQDGLPDEQITALALDSTNTLYVGTPLGMAAVRDGAVVTKGLEGEFIQSLAAKEEQVIASTFSGQCYRLDSGLRLRSDSTPNFTATKGNFPRSLRLHAFGPDLLASSGSGLWRASVSDRHLRWSELLSLEPDARPALTDRNVSSLGLDSSGRLWVGYFDNGLDIVDWSRDSVTHLRDDALFCINHIECDQKSGVTYVSTANGLAVFTSPSDHRLLRTENGLINNHINMAVPEEPGSRNLYVATAGGLSIVRPDGVSSLYAFHGLPSNHLYSLAPSRDGLYIGTLAGLSHVTRQEPPRNYSRDNSPLRHNWVNAALVVGHDLWLGTYGGGIQILQEHNRWRDVAGELSHLHVNPSAMLLHNRKVYAGSLEAGFIIIDTETLNWAQVRAPLPSQNVNSFAADPRFLYVGTDRGLVRFSHEDLSLAPMGQASR